MYGRSWWRLGGLILLVGFAIRLDAQTPASGPPELFVTRLQGATTGTTTSQQATPERPAGLPPLPVTGLDDRVLAADLDGPRRVSLTISRPMPLRDLLLLLVNGTPLSLVNDEAVDGNFVGDLKDLTMRQALEAVLFPRGLDYDVQGTLIRVFPHRASTRLFDVNYLNVRRTWQRGIRSSASVGGQVPAAGLSASSESDLFDELAKGVQALLSASGRLHVDRVAGLVQVTDFSDRLDQVGVYVEAVQLRAMRQVRIVAHVFDVSFREWSAAAAIDWKAVAVRTGAGTRSSDGHGAAGLTVADIEVLKQAIAEQGTVTMLAAPQVVAMNNEPAVMRVGTETVYFESASSVAQDDARQRTTKPGAVLEGLTLTVTAQISADGLVLLNVSPTYASRAGQSKSVDGETFPVLRISEADMMVRVRDGETIVLSGFLENRETTKPATGMAAMFGARPRTTVKSELVILLTPSIVSPGVPAAANR